MLLKCTISFNLKPVFKVIMTVFLQYMHFFLAFTLRLFFLFTPFFILSTFLSLTRSEEPSARHKLAFNIASSAAAVCIVIFLFGVWFMRAFGITVAAFRAGSGFLLMLSAISLVYGKEQKEQANAESLNEMALVPLAVPVTAGPATLGTLMVAGMDCDSIMLKIISVVGIVAAAAMIGALLYYSTKLEDFIGKARIKILSKVTGLILSAIAAQMLVEGIRELWLT